jgi:hypothetical protein
MKIDIKIDTENPRGTLLVVDGVVVGTLLQVMFAQTGDDLPALSVSQYDHTNPQETRWAGFAGGRVAGFDKLGMLGDTAGNTWGKPR